MKKNIILFVSLFFLFPIVTYAVPANSAFRDDNFYQCVVSSFNSDNGASLSVTSNLSDEQLQRISNLICSNKNVVDVSGIEKLINLKRIELNHNKIKNINLSANKSLEILWLFDNELTEIDLSNNQELIELDLSDNQLTNIDVSKNTKLTIVALFNNHLKEIDLSKNTSLKWLLLSNNKLTKINVENNSLLEHLWLFGNELTEIDLSKNVLLTELYLYDTQLTNIDLSENIVLNDLDLSNTKLTNIDLSKNIALEHLTLENNQLTNIDVSKNIALNYLDLSGNQLKTVDLSKNIALEHILLENNHIKNINLSNNTLLSHLNLSNNQLRTIDLSKNIKLSSYSLFLNNNPWKKDDIYLFKGDVIQYYSNGVIILPDITFTKNHYKSLDKKLAIVDNQGKIVAKSSGNVIVTHSNNSYSESINVHVSDIKSWKYTIHKDSRIIDIGNEKNVSTILKHIHALNGQIAIYDKDNYPVKNGYVSEEYKLVLKNNDHVVSSFILNNAYGKDVIVRNSIMLIIVLLLIGTFLIIVTKINNKKVEKHEK